jgi:signal transduction histidine kinase
MRVPRVPSRSRHRSVWRPAFSSGRGGHGVASYADSTGGARLGHGSRQAAEGLVAGAAAIAVVTAVIAALDQVLPLLSLTGLYLFAIVPVAIHWGFAVAGIVAIASYLTFAYFLAEPIHSFRIADSETAAGLSISIITAYVVSELARRAQAGADEARLRAEEAERAQQAYRRLAEEQAALRRVATLVATAVETSEILEAVTREVGLQCDADLARMVRFEPDRTVTALAAWAREGEPRLAVGRRFALEGQSTAAQVYETGRPARVDSFEGASGPIAREAQALGIRASVGCPIVVAGQIWGVIAAATRREAPFPADTESRIAEFTELVATTVANAEARADLVDSRARLLTAADDARRRVVRDLHDGAQQRLVHAIITLKLATREQESTNAEAATALVSEALDQAQQANAELRELAHGLHPAVLIRGGLAAGLETLASRMRVPVSVEVPGERFPREIEASAYFVVAEALTNIAKHSGAGSAQVAAWIDDGALCVEVRDDGVGGARPDGSGLLGLGDRLAALGGRLRIESPPGRGTRIAASLPLPHTPGQESRNDD